MSVVPAWTIVIGIAAVGTGGHVMHRHGHGSWEIGAVLGVCLVALAAFRAVSSRNPRQRRD